MSNWPEWTSPDGRIRLINADCLEVRDSLSEVDAVIADPPYGMGWNTDSTRFSGGVDREARHGLGRSDWGDIAADNTPFDPTPWLDYPHVVLWGCNHFAARLPIGTTLVWVKKPEHLYGTFLSDAELAWMKGGHGVYCYHKNFPPPSRMFEAKGPCAHPTQKPIGLMAWCIDKAKVPDGGLVLDPYAGSGTTAIACIRTNRRCIAIECDPKHYATAKARLEREYARTVLFNEQEACA
jgi:site-specific DNA-methyltransferase (adenine-specific)